MRPLATCAEKPVSWHQASLTCTIVNGGSSSVTTCTGGSAYSTRRCLQTKQRLCEYVCAQRTAEPTLSSRGGSDRQQISQGCGIKRMLSQLPRAGTQTEGLASGCSIAGATPLLSILEVTPELELKGYAPAWSREPVHTN